MNPSATFIRFLLCTPLLFLLCCRPPAKEQSPRPNILLLVADDLGYADLGCYGGDISTPNIDGLAAQGLRFSRFHTSPLCAPTRSMLLSGNDNHLAGMGFQDFAPGEFGYEGKLTDRVASIPELLRQAGYHTYMAGKWHLAEDFSVQPGDKDFEHFFVAQEGAANHYDSTPLFAFMPEHRYLEDGQPAEWPDGAYSTDLYTDKLIEYIGRHSGDGQPFFAFAAFTSPHWPLQVDEPYWKKYEGRYNEGYEALKARRLQSLKDAGMIPDSASLPPSHPRVVPWDSLSPDEKRKEARKMELYAGMVDNLDHNIGRLLNYLKETGQYDNTLIVFMADNGAAAEDFYDHDFFGPFLRERFTDSYEDMGKANAFVSYGPQWAEASSAPFRYFKGLTTEGGIVAPMILSGPGVTRKGEIFHRLATVMDMAPTFYDAAGISYPDSLKGKAVYPLKGSSMLPLASGQDTAVHGPDYVFALEHSNHCMLIKGDWKVTNIRKPYALANFSLYHLPTDLAELHDRKAEEPDKFMELIGEWEKFIGEIKAQFPPPRR